MCVECRGSRIRIGRMAKVEGVNMLSHGRSMSNGTVGSAERLCKKSGEAHLGEAHLGEAHLGEAPRHET
jgi:hypothetical protein